MEEYKIDLVFKNGRIIKISEEEKVFFVQELNFGRKMIKFERINCYLPSDAFEIIGDIDALKASFVPLPVVQTNPEV